MDPSAALAMAGWVVQVIFDKLADTALQAWASRAHLREEIELLLTHVNRTSVLLEAAKGRREIGSTSLAKCLNELVYLALAAEDLVDELDFYRLQTQVEGPGKQQVKTPTVTSTRQIVTTSIASLVSRFGFGSPADITSPKIEGIGLDRSKISSQIKEIIMVFNIIGDSVMRGLNLESLHSIGEEIHKIPTEKIQTTKYTTVKMIGRGREVKHILKLLSSSFSDEVISVFPIVGNGGIGKTTLARHLYNHPRIKELFDLQMWVSVSASFDKVSVTRDMLEHVSRDRHAEIHSLNMLQEILEEKLKKVNRSLLVLDGMWELKDAKCWETLLAPMRFGEKKGNAILVTTRQNSLVEKLGAKYFIQLDGLNDGEFWSLFEACAFGPVKIENSEYLEFIGKEIAKQLNGYPLAAKSVGGLLKRNHDVVHWKKILNANAWKYLQDGGDIMPTLKLSYNHLPFPLQRCFAYCSLFPKKYSFDSKELVYLWVAQGFIPMQKSKKVEEIGNEYLSVLLDWAFFEKDHFHGKYMMHDLMHDLAQMVSLDECLSIDGSNIRDIPATVRHLSIITKFAYGKDQQSNELQFNESFENKLVEVCGSLEIEKLRTLLLIGQYDPHFAKTFATVFREAKQLRVLCLTGMHYDINHLICNFENLIHLRYLALSTSKAGKPLPKSLCNLYHLQFLDISRCKHLSDLPEGLDNLISLHRLMAEKELHSMIPNIGKLSSLQKLDEFRVRKVSGFEIMQLKNLGELGGSLRILGLENVETKEEARGARLAHKKHLRNLCLIWEKERANSGFVAKREVIEGLKPHGNLRKLLVSGYGGDVLPTWFDAKMSLTSLENLSIENCKALDILPPLGQLPCLKKLHLVNLGAMKEIKDQFYGTSVVNGFPALEHMEMVNMPILKKWVATDGEKFFLSLTRLVITNCEKLEELPFKGKHWFCLLSEVTIKNCHMLCDPVPLPFTDKLTTVSVNRAGDLGLINLRDGNLKIKHVGAGTAVRIFQVVYQNLNKIRVLNLKKCPNISPLLWDGFQQTTSFKQLQVLDYPKFISVKKLLIELCRVTGKQLSLMLLELPSLSKLYLKKCVPIDPVDDDQCLFEIPPSLALLEHLTIVDCPSLKINKKEGFTELSSLRDVRIIDCPDFFSSLTPSNDQIETNRSSLLPSSVKTLRVSGLTDVLMTRLLLNLSSLAELQVVRSPKLSVLNLQSCYSAKKLVFKNCVKLCLIPGIGSITGLKCLLVNKCPVFLSTFLGELFSFRVLSISNSSSLTDMLAIYIALLQHLTIDFSSLSQHEQPTGLIMEHEKDFKGLASLRVLKFMNCMDLQSLPSELCCMVSLEELWVSDCPKIVVLPLKGLPLSLKSLFVYRCSEELKEQCRNIPGVTVHS
ncbi:disease resistance RPP13-like protein 1 [Carex littledalei]|uniref:Disease resistance RPP13-like protein 1 n=1 Tax=Carex littledalei TaxID=544730 RepID=A0A833RL02_9POAL|nr:disease resistance RPP13-like protein 1 [Carex littledalei]